MPDGYARILFIEDLPELERTIFRLQAECDADGAPNQARVIRQAYINLLQTLDRISVQVAEEATARIRSIERSTRVRPDTGLPDAQRLETHLESDPLRSLPGSVGIINEKKLDDSPVYWWWTNEVGYTGNVGRTVNGLFYEAGFGGGGVAADAGQSREHPLFRPGGPQPSGGSSSHDELDVGGGGRMQPAMTIANPIPAREFVKRGIAEVEPKWWSAIARAKADLERVVLTALDEAAAIRASGVRRP